MSETCIVCLGELGLDPPPPPPLQGPLSPSSDPKPADSEPDDDDEDIQRPSAAAATAPAAAASPTAPKPPSELIAHLIPCGHNLHDDCLRPWVERANSCPICRQSFNRVELTATIGGAVTASYDVADRAQEAEVDPAMFMDEPEDDTAPCPKCGRDDNEDVLLLCDSCNGAYHTYCVGLDEVPTGHWFCETCDAARALPAVSEARGRPPPHHGSNRRTRGQLRRLRHQDDASSSNWARVWQSVWDRLNIDLDFPFDSPDQRQQRRRPHRGGIRAWERRLQVAERQGAASRFRDTAPALFDRPTMSRPRPEPPRPESTEEILAWNALEKARDIQADPAVRTRKRKSSSSSPSESETNRRKRPRRSITHSPTDLPAPQPERPLKRPNTRRGPGLGVIVNGNHGEASRPRQRSIVSIGASSPDATGTAPTFLQSLLREVESSAVPDDPGGPANGHSDHPSPQMVASPGPSPVASAHPSPGARSGTPPPISPRSLSPVPLTSRIEPLYPRAPDLNYEDLSPMGKALKRRTSKSQTRVPRWLQQTGPTGEPPRARSEEASPTRTNMSLEAKASVQRLVKEALREPYAANQVSKDQYTDINRTVSRRLYELVGERGLSDEPSSTGWQQLAHREVAQALSALTGDGGETDD